MKRVTCPLRMSAAPLAAACLLLLNMHTVAVNPCNEAQHCIQRPAKVYSMLCSRQVAA